MYQRIANGPQLIQANRETRNSFVYKGGFHYTNSVRMKDTRRLFERGGFAHVLTRRFRVVACRRRAHLSTSDINGVQGKVSPNQVCSRLEIPSICIRATNVSKPVEEITVQEAFVLFHSGVAPFMVFIGSVAIELFEQRELGWKQVRIRVSQDVCVSRYLVFGVNGRNLIVEE